MYGKVSQTKAARVLMLTMQIFIRVLTEGPVSDCFVILMVALPSPTRIGANGKLVPGTRLRNSSPSWSAAAWMKTSLVPWSPA